MRTLTQSAIDRAVKAAKAAGMEAENIPIPLAKQRLGVSDFNGQSENGT